ncbi:hypothetical protein TPHA_0G02640 [Tetrapisispora phaffii CBS 4417]|uniref:GATA-type domain-containing protein n=1 Tax=Tetrapisispora phaffii (strain ATCC 24235 / CBS 4417 / NBRC 1672 / NRRL Y-8282 / UCD 70-5) TaxID=1071381 RepID=G8BW23_TETPH|nr:hypothetical protein TPHA_0G02640 [Tetrapisispora phaffii CBS 4417]CCE64101.1 hypothetical protein TPHA_0G02640 [Tetrapisispora phaffii CBS 4417]
MGMLNVENNIKNELLEFNSAYIKYNSATSNDDDILKNIPMEKFYNFLVLLGVLEKDMKALLKLKQISINNNKSNASVQKQYDIARDLPSNSSKNYIYADDHQEMSKSNSTSALTQSPPQFQLPPISHLTNPRSPNTNSHLAEKENNNNSNVFHFPTGIHHTISDHQSIENAPNSCEKLIMRIKKRNNLHNPYNYMGAVNSNQIHKRQLADNLQSRLINNNVSHLHPDSRHLPNNSINVSNVPYDQNNPSRNQKLLNRVDPPTLFCKQCNENETPEWRRGPYGNKTLCNACGLYYSKLIKKFNSEQANIIMRYKKTTYPSDRKIPLQFEIPINFIEHLKNDSTLDDAYFNK